MDQALVLSGLHSRRLIQMVRRVIVPAAAVKDTIELLSALDHPPPVVSLDEAASQAVTQLAKNKSECHAQRGCAA